MESGNTFRQQVDKGQDVFPDFPDITDIEFHQHFVQSVGNVVQIAAQRHKILPLNGGNEGLHQSAGHLVFLRVRFLFHGVHLFQIFLQSGVVVIADSVLEEICGFVRAFHAGYQIFVVEVILFLFHLLLLFLIQMIVCYSRNKNSLAIPKPIRPQPGKVRTQVRTMSFTTA